MNREERSTIARRLGVTEPTRWLPIQLAIYIVVPVATALLYGFGLAWCAGWTQ